jgi:hypothetical protein
MTDSIPLRKLEGSTLIIDEEGEETKRIDLSTES